MSKRTIIIADNQDITRLGLRHIISLHHDDAEVMEAGITGEVEELVTRLPDAVVIIDPVLMGYRATDDIITLAHNNKDVQWVIFSNDISDMATQRFSSMQNISILLKSCHQDEITSGIVLALTHQRFICHRLMDILLNGSHSAQDPLTELSATEKEILRLTAMGKTVKEIANKRNSSAHTITTHKRNIFRKLKVNTSYEATMVAAKAGLIDLIEYYI